MKKNMALQSAVIVIVPILGTAALALTLLREFEADAPIEGVEMPKAMVAIANKYDRVYGYVRDNVACFYFHGNMKRLNGFLSEIAECSGCDLEVVLTTTPGTGKRASVFVRTSSGSKNAFKYDWRMRIEKLPRKEDQAGAWIAEVLVPVTSHKMLAKLRLPLAFRASLGGDMAELVQFHNSRRMERGESESSTTPARLKGPTTMEMMIGRRAFSAREDGS